MKQGVTFAILAYREEENLEFLLPEILQIADDGGYEYEIIVVDTKEPLDDTEMVCKKYGCIYANQKYPRFGGAFRTAIELAQYDKFLILDGDGSHPTRYIADIYGKFTEGKYDIVIGSRYVRGGHSHDSASSVFMSRILNIVFKLALGINVYDLSTDYRIYRTELLKQVELTHENYDVLQEVLLKIKIGRGDAFSIAEVPITFEKRKYGSSKRHLVEFIISYIRSLFRLVWIRIRSG